MEGGGTTPLRGKCNETSQCFGEYVECRLNICKCQLGYLPRIDNGDLCGEASAHHVEVPTTDPTMIGVVVGLALMSVTLCIVLRLFAKARFRENRTIFNTPNPRLMNVSLLKGSKTLVRGNSAGQRSRRGSQASIASGQAEGQTGEVTTAPDGNGRTDNAPARSSSQSHPHRVKPSRTISTDTNHEGTPTQSSRQPGSERAGRGKYRQDSVASNV